MAPGIPLLSRTRETMLITAMEHKGVVGDGFQMVAFPAAIDSAKFLCSHGIQYPRETMREILGTIHIQPQES